MASRNWLRAGTLLACGLGGTAPDWLSWGHLTGTPDKAHLLHSNLALAILSIIFISLTARLFAALVLKRLRITK